jgi:hypothetical protein
MLDSIVLNHSTVIEERPESIERLRDDFERSALDWLERASVAETEGRQGAATEALVVAGIAARVACGRPTR